MSSPTKRKADEEPSEVSEPLKRARTEEDAAEVNEDQPAPSTESTVETTAAADEEKTNASTTEDAPQVKSEAQPASSTESDSTVATPAPAADATDEEKAKAERAARRRMRKSGWDSAPANVPATSPASATTTAPATTPTAADPAISANLTSLLQQAQLAQLQQQQQQILAQQRLLAQLQLRQQQQSLIPQPPKIPDTRVYVGSLSYELHEEHVRAPFSAFGPIVKIDMPRENGKSKGFCFIEYATPSAAQAAINTMNGFQLGGRSIKVGRPTHVNSGSAAPAPNPLLGLGGYSGGLGGLAGLGGLGMAGLAPATLAGLGGMATPLTASISPPSTPGQSFCRWGAEVSTNSNCRIYVGSIQFDISAENVKTVFEPFGRVVSAQLIPNPETGKHKGYGFVEFADEKSANDAIESMNGFNLMGRQLKVGRAAGPQGGGAAGPTSAAIAQTVMAQQAQQRADALSSGSSDLGQEDGNMRISAAQRAELMAKLSREGPDSPVVLLTNMTTIDEVDEDLPEEVKEECQKFGPVAKVVIHPVQGTKDVSIFVQFVNQADATRARGSLDKRWFGGRVISAAFFSRAKFEAGIYD